MSELFWFKINTTPFMARRTMEDAIEICRQRAMGGQSVTLYGRTDPTKAWTVLGNYSPCNPIRVTDRYTGEVHMVPCCCAEIVPPKEYHF